MNDKRAYGLKQPGERGVGVCVCGGVQQLQLVLYLYMH